MTFTGPDCGLGGWPNQEAAALLLERTVKAVKHKFNAYEFANKKEKKKKSSYSGLVQLVVGAGS